MKICSKCKIEKPLDSFHNHKKYRKNQWCKICMKEYDRIRHTAYPPEMKERKKREEKKRKIKSRNYLFEFLKDHPCIDCGERDILVLEFDHQRDKINNISDMVSRGSGIETIKREIEKCEVRCANCHKKKTAKQRGYYKFLNGQ